MCASHTRVKYGDCKPSNEHGRNIIFTAAVAWRQDYRQTYIFRTRPLTLNNLMVSPCFICFNPTSTVVNNKRATDLVHLIVNLISV